jgi:septum formation protein
LNLLKQIKIAPDEVYSPDIDEVRLKGEKAYDMVVRLSGDKCRKAMEKFPDDIVIAADNVSVVGGKVLDKTFDPEIERAYLKLISGRRHKLYCSLSVGVKSQDILIQRTVESSLKFKRMSESEIEEYVASAEWRGCGGGYAVEGMAAKYLSWISGSFSAIQGLPLHELHQILSGIKNN